MRCKSTVLLSIGALFLIGGSASPIHAQMEYDVNFILGQKTLDEGDWAPLEEQVEVGACSTFGKVDWPVKIALDLVTSMDDTTVVDVDFEAKTTELDAGIRKIWKKSNVRPFVGGGLAFLSGEFEILDVSVDDDGVGLWVDGGVFWRLGKRFNIGLEARISRGEVTIGPFDVEAGGEHVGLILGFGSPSD